jgi:amidase
VPAALLDAFWEYERAITENDIGALDRLFATGKSTLRGDAAGILIGHDAIAEFRKDRRAVPARQILHVEVQVIEQDAALVVAITAPHTGGRGQQTQLWRFIDGAWRVTAAHVALPPKAIDESIWRLVGAPLIPATEEGPLSGETVAVKDLYDLAGFVVGAGIPEYLAEGTPAAMNAPAVQALLDAGAVVTGIAQTDEFAYSIAGRNQHYGTPPNPAVNGGVSGGSSSGPASAVATGQASIGLGTDTAGSIRVPASYQGLWGLRPTHGSVSSEGVLPLAQSFDTPGWMTRDAATLRTVVEASLSSSVAAGAFVVAPALMGSVERDVRTAFTAFVGDAFPTVELPDPQELLETFRTVQQAEAWRNHGKWIAEHPDALGLDVAGRFALASRVTSDQALAARRRMLELRMQIDAALENRVLLLPAASSSAPKTTADAEHFERTRQGTLRLTAIAGLTGRPALSVPLLSVPQPGSLLPAPVGLCLVGPRGSDLALIDLAEGLSAL